MKPILKVSNTLARKRRDAGFTLTELLFILAVVAIIACVQCAALAGGRARTLITECASHLRQFDLAMQLYAHDNHDALPKMTLGPFSGGAPGVWPWDMPVFITDVLEPYGATRNILYCPANAEFNNNHTWNFWNYVGMPPSDGFRILGYVTTLPDIHQVPTNLKNATLTPQSYSNGLAPALPSHRVLAADVTISYYGSYDQIPIGGLPTTIAQRTSHLDGKYPLGGNVAMLDGHVEWRPFSEMKVAFGTPTFHW